jgi:hypothetical protein
MTEAEKNKGYVDHINKNREVPYTYEELKSMGFPTYITENGLITWD